MNRTRQSIGRALGLAVACVSVPPLTAQQPPAAAEPLALVNARVVDVRTGSISAPSSVVVRDGVIASIGGPPPPGVRVVDVRGNHLLPGLIDAHTHMADLDAARRALESGVTTVRGAGGATYNDVALGILSARGAIAGPDVVPAGIFVRAEIGSAIVADPRLADLLPRADTIDKLRRLVRINLEHGVGVIKTAATERAGLVGTDPRKQVLTEAEVRAIVEEASAGGVPVEAHAHGDEGAYAAVSAGVRSIEHGTYLSDRTLRLMEANGTFLVPTYMTVVDVSEAGGDYDVPALRVRGRHMLPRLRDVVARARAIGVRLVTGSDTSYGPSSLTRIAHEIGAFVDMGLTPLEAIQAATVTPAELLGLERHTGAIETGLEADLIAVAADPLADVGVIEDVLLVISNGRVAIDRLNFEKAASGF
ncbi:MAG: amidohydrolase family protein [Vicinamibacterales bacterium]|jgi:imidazolonepropionase-like amidohydrolase|nr:hypothetical protein [Acidobacteriota bacterium]MDP6372874.1 amidohydrolase family protein [Vicinamibacterales bacterium]MDP6607797.1 amidohydrolase family protein [Vicinamibacterales bacterium]HAK54858.1 hypothetical protein [Acidobacteriota bacterium]|tara:strand:+ start:1499 stop:2758 length:1260 start_codon:yes stop_codon:yes gene_type:complete